MEPIHTVGRRATPMKHRHSCNLPSDPAAVRNAPRIAAMKLAAGFVEASIGSGDKLAQWASRHPDKWAEATMLLARLSGYPVEGEVPRSVLIEHGHGPGDHLRRKRRRKRT
jgi:hypothetical protein